MDEGRAKTVPVSFSVVLGSKAPLAITQTYWQLSEKTE